MQAKVSFYTSFYSIGNKLYLTRVDDGITSHQVVEFGADIFIPLHDTTEQPDSFTYRYEPLKKLSFPTPKQAKEFAKDYSCCYGYNRFDYLKVNEMFPNKINFDPSQIRVAYIDIETETEYGFPDVATGNEVVLLITLFCGGKRYTLSTRKAKPRLQTKFIAFDTEAEMFSAFIALMKHVNPHIITGWNCRYFDIPYLLKRMEVIVGAKETAKLSPFNRVEIKEVVIKGKQNYEGIIYGIPVLDYLELYKKFELSPRESYKLDAIAELELGANKLSFEGSFKDFYTNDFDTFVDYNIVDVELVQKLDDKLQFILLNMSVAYTAKTNYIDVLSVTRVWDNMIAIHLLTENKQVEYSVQHSGSRYEGAFVKDTVPGFYQWLASFDLESLYPSIMIMWNISPDTMLDPKEFIRITPHDIVNNTPLYQRAIERARELNATLCANGSMYSKEKQGFIPKLTDMIFGERKDAKNQMKDWKREYESAILEAKRRGLSYE